eukprot:6429207-Pyramimonas_sp.AAC.1
MSAPRGPQDSSSEPPGGGTWFGEETLQEGFEIAPAGSARTLREHQDGSKKLRKCSHGGCHTARLYTALITKTRLATFSWTVWRGYAKRQASVNHFVL